MGWRNVIITQHSKLTYSMNMMVVQSRDGINQIPIEDINLVLVSTSQAVITSALVSKLIKNNSKIIFVNDKYEPIGETNGYQSSGRNLKTLEIQLNWDKDRIELLWTKIIFAKIRNQIKVLKNYKLKFKEIEVLLDKIEINDVTNRESVAARKYFMTLFGENFKRRNSNVINAALDYGYSILLSACNREVAINGYLSNLGIHHHSVSNEFNLGCDLMEPFRPYVDYWVKAHEKSEEFTPDIKYGLVELLNLEIMFNGKKTLLSNALTKYIRDCFKFLSGKKNSIQIEMGLTNEVPNNAINDNV